MNKFKYLFAKWDLDRTIESHSVFFTRSHRDQFRFGIDLLPGIDVRMDRRGIEAKRPGP